MTGVSTLAFLFCPANNEGMFVPQFTLRRLLVLTACGGVVFTVVGLAVRGSAWAAGITVALATLVVALFIHAALFTVIWTASEAAGGEDEIRPLSPAERPPIAPDFLE